MDRSWNFVEIIVLVLAAGCFLVHFILVNARSNRRNQAPVETARALVYYKHPDMEPVLAGRHSSYLYYVTFHTDAGDILKLSLNPADYVSLSEGSYGMLTWQHDRFWKFEKEE